MCISREFLVWVLLLESGVKYTLQINGMKTKYTCSKEIFGMNIRES